MSAVGIAREEFAHAVRSRLLWATVAVLGFLTAVAIAGVAADDVPGADPSRIVPVVSNVDGLLLVPTVGLLVGFPALAGERRSGRIRTLFGLGYGRRDLFLGASLGRLAVAAAAALVAWLAAVSATLALFHTVPVRPFLAHGALTIALGAAFASIGVGISAVVATRVRAAAGAVGSYVAFALAWHPAVAGLHYLVEGDLPKLFPPEWYLLLLRLNPLEAYAQVAGELADRHVWGIVGWPTVVEDVGPYATGEASALLVSNRVHGNPPFYLDTWFAAVVLLCWIAVPLAVGYWRFARADLN